MAGNIIPAIATTNAIIAGMLVMQATKLLSRNLAKSRKMYLRSDATRPLGRGLPDPPDPKCAICRDAYISLKTDPTKLTLGTFVKDIVKQWLVKNTEGGDDIEWSIMEGGRVLADPDFDDNLERTLGDLNIERGKIITARDEDEKYRPVQFCLSAL
jgi:ubiquitin-like 1-activating enzyme E1 B